jgi:hypothetical protein
MTWVRKIAACNSPHLVGCEQHCSRIPAIELTEDRMWNVALAMMAVGAGTIMYDGSPMAPPTVLWDLVDQHQFVRFVQP